MTRSLLFEEVLTACVVKYKCASTLINANSVEFRTETVIDSMDISKKEETEYRCKIGILK